jgi:hypothetical protein
VARRPPRLVVAALLLLLAAGFGSGCGVISELVELQQRIQDRGYRVDSVFHDDFSSGTSEVQVSARSGQGLSPPEGQEEIAGIVWQTYGRRFDTVSVELDDELVRFTRGDLQERFGARPTDLDEREFGDDVATGLRAAAWYGAVVLVLGAGAIVTTLVLLRRRRRYSALGSPGGSGAGGAGSAWGAGAGSGSWGAGAGSGSAWGTGAGASAAGAAGGAGASGWSSPPTSPASPAPPPPPPAAPPPAPVAPMPKRV